MLICTVVNREVVLSFYSRLYMGIELNHRGPASNTRACVTDPDVILNTCSSTDLAHARDRTFRSADKIAVSELPFHQYDICCVTLLRTDRHTAACFHKRSQHNAQFLETPTGQPALMRSGSEG
jgi:hypothetical protein